uniref:PlsC domain-containing protein n=1 Tax=Caenorhabditis tropicalis TaxID=1561998 RepID=A0A1I7TX66_9PELO
MEGENEKKKRDANIIDHVISWIVFLYAGIVTSFISPIVLISLFYLTFPFLLVSNEFRKIVMRVLARASNLQFISCVRLAGIKVMMSGDNLDRLSDCRALMLPNHLSLFDHFIFMTAADTFGINAVGRWIFVIYNMWIYTPLGWLWSSYGNYFIDSVPIHKREETLSSLRKHFDRIYHEADLRWVCLYPEGSRLFLIQKRNAEYEKKKGLPPLEHCAYPRLGAALSAIKVLGPDPNDPSKANNGKGPPLEYLVDVTLGYPDGIILPTHEAFLSAFRNRDSKPYAIHYEIFKMDTKWREEEELRKFLFDRYQKKVFVLIENIRVITVFKG